MSYSFSGLGISWPALTIWWVLNGEMTMERSFGD